nr:replication-associated protein [Wheat dwarf India virus]
MSQTSAENNSANPRASSSTFRYRSNNCFLTFPHCNSCPYGMVQHFWDLISIWSPIYAVASVELHQDGTPHLHALLQTRKQITTNDPHFFDFDGHHPHIQAAKNPTLCRDYILKSPVTFSEKGAFIPRGRNAGTSTRHSGKRSRDDIMKDIIENSTNKSDYLSKVRRNFPYDWATKLYNFEYSASKLFPEQQPEYTNPHGQSVPDLYCYETIQDWIDSNLFQVHPYCYMLNTPTYIVGPTRTGKSTWSRSLGRHNYWQNNVDFTVYDPEAAYNIIDDIPFKFCPCWKQLVAAQRDFTVNPKYGKKKLIKGGIPSIILVNSDEDWLKTMTPEQQEYFEANSIIYMMEPTEKFFGGAESV